MRMAAGKAIEAERVGFEPPHSPAASGDPVD